MGDELVIGLVIWFTIGVVIGGWISVDTFRRGIKDARWIALGVVLSFIGLAIYLLLRNKQKTEAPHASYKAPEYRLEHKEVPASQPSPQYQPVEPVPSAVESSTIVLPATEQDRPAPSDAPPAQEPAYSAPVQEPVPEYQPQEPAVKEPIEGIPRCPKCGSAISAYEDFCSECGTKLK
jgi:hypothetical protein